MNLSFRPLRADEVECRVAQVGKAKTGDPLPWITLLLYKDARCDMNVLDEAVGPMNWQRKHTRNNANCIVSIWDDEKKMWVEKEDTGTESNTEKEKGIASDSFKRACFCWGVGRELYTGPMIFIPHIDKRDGKENYEIRMSGEKAQPNANFVVTFMAVKDGRITGLNIENTKLKRTVFAWGKLDGC